MALTALQREFRARVKKRLQKLAEYEMIRSVVTNKYSVDAVTGSIVTPRNANGTLHRNTRLYAVTVPGIGVKQLAESTIRKMLTS